VHVAASSPPPFPPPVSLQPRFFDHLQRGSWQCFFFRSAHVPAASSWQPSFLDQAQPFFSHFFFFSWSAHVASSSMASPSPSPLVHPSHVDHVQPFFSHFFSFV
jgi:hypothetical protein